MIVELVTGTQLDVGSLRDVLAEYPPTARLRFDTGEAISGPSNYRGQHDEVAFESADPEYDSREIKTVGALVAVLDQLLDPAVTNESGVMDDWRVWSDTAVWRSAGWTTRDAQAVIGVRAVSPL